jgi:hypothetical protein
MELTIKRGFFLILPAVALCAFLAFPGVSRAGKKEGTFVLIQAEGGFASCPYTQVTGSLGYGLLLGIGGKFKGWPLRFYLIGGLVNATYWHHDSFSKTGEDYRMSLNFLDAGMGLRVLLPIVPQVRIYLDVLGVGSFQKASVDKGRGNLQSSAWTGGAILAGGIEWRWHRNLATGIRLEGSIYRNLTSNLPQVVGIEGKSSGRLFIGLTQSFLF